MTSYWERGRLARWRNTYLVMPLGAILQIELPIVIAAIGILVAIVVPPYMSGVRKANEAAAVTTLNAIRIAQARYELDHKGESGTFRPLFEEGYF
ncbi:MAG: hypothetical protein ABI967_13925 [bacterium]